MKVRVKKRFIKNLESLGSRELVDECELALQAAEDAANPNDIPAFKWLSGYANYGRIRVGDYRIGLRIDGDTICFICLLHRSVVYRHFP